MFFSFYSKNISFEGELLYMHDEYSLIYEPNFTNAGLGISCGTCTELNVIYETCDIVHISGLSPKNSWIIKTMNIPKAKRGRLWVHIENLPMEGMCLEYGKLWDTYYDEEKQYICIGDYCTDDYDDCVEFANNLIAVLREGNLIAVWAKIKEVQ